MAFQNETFTDPLIDEVRQRRRDLFGRCDNDLSKLIEMIERCQAEHPHMVVDPRRLVETRESREAAGVGPDHGK